MTPQRGPSAWSHRAPAVVLALLGASVAGYLALYQAGAIGTVWEPFFQGGSERILHSPVARLLPVPDAVVGVAAYLVEAVLLAAGDEQRWHERPRLVLAMGVVVGVMAVAAVGLVAVQVLGFGTGCTLCLVSAAISLALAALAAPEVAASIHRVRGRPTGLDSRSGGRLRANQ